MHVICVHDDGRSGRGAVEGGGRLFTCGHGIHGLGYGAARFVQDGGHLRNLAGRIGILLVHAVLDGVVYLFLRSIWRALQSFGRLELRRRPIGIRKFFGALEPVEMPADIFKLKNGCVACG